MEEKIKLFEKLSENIQNLECIENEIAMLQLAINQKNVENLKEDKMNEIKEFFNQQMRIYKQNNEKYREDIEDKINNQIRSKVYQHIPFKLLIFSLYQ